jgi:demethylmenaquinone methyltransferase/2-methoxy-6-polyprenyl-1,4-benzoquinol methylase
MPQAEARKSANPESEWFGFRRVKPDEKTGLVREVFDSVAGRYDLMNDLMSGGLHRLWKDSLVRMMDPQPGQTILDVAGGTGDISLRCQQRITKLAQSRLRPPKRAQSSRAHIMVCDINEAMLKEGRARMIDRGILHGIEWITGNAEDLPIPSRSVDTYCIAFGLRNVTHIDKALKEAARVLRPGGKFFCLEFSPGVRKEIKPLYDRYCLDVLPRIGSLVARDSEAYRYLAESIQQFPAQPVLAARMEKAGLSGAVWRNLTGGIAVIHSGWRV